MELIDNIRYDHPKIFKTSIAVVVAVIVSLLFMSLPPSPLLHAVGVTRAQQKISALYYAIFWQIRAAANGSDSDPSVLMSVTYGNLLGLDKGGMLIASMLNGSRFQQTSVHIADTKITDLYGAATLIGGLRMEDARFDVYPNNQVVIWVRNVPVNVKLIESGFAVPDPNPPTNIVDRAFSTYYWRIFNGNNNDKTS